MSKLDRKVLRVYLAAMARWEEYLAHHKGDIDVAMTSLYSKKALVLARACAAAKKGKRK